MNLPFDQVILVNDGIQRRLAPAQFLALPLHQRVRFILQGRLTFLLGDAEIDRRAALQAMMAVSRAA